MSLAALMAALVVLLHIGFVAFAAFGSLLALRRPAVALVQVPAAAWAAYVELSGRICPLTPLENMLRKSAGLDPYSGDFIARWVFPWLYPEGLTRDAQMAAGAFVASLNAAVYGWLLWTRRRRTAHARPPAAPPLPREDR